MRAVLVLGGDPPTDEELVHLDTADLVVATDGGAAALLEGRRFPDRIVGDLDSLTPDLVAFAEAEGVTIERHPSDKAETDGELAMRHVMTATPDEIVLLGGHGGRSAMFLTHLRLLRRAAEAGIRARMVGHRETLRVLLAGGVHEADPPVVLDLVAMEPAVVDLEGLRYAGEGIRLAPWTGRGVTNPVDRPNARVVVRSGVVLVIEEHG